MKIPGWRPEGYATLSKGLGKKFVFGVHQKIYKDVSERAYLFSKNVGTTFYLPSGNWVARNTKGLEVLPDFWILMAEAGGSASKAPKQRAGTKAIVPNDRCPEWVHNSWVTPDDDEHDADTKGKKWPAWHPMWDPCYWWYVSSAFSTRRPSSQTYIQKQPLTFLFSSCVVHTIMNTEVPQTTS